MAPSPDRIAALRSPAIRRWITLSLVSGLSYSALATILAYEIFQITNDYAALGYLGLVEAIPSLSIALIAGHWADRFDRRKILVGCAAVAATCSLSLALLTAQVARPSLWAIFGLVFIEALTRGIRNPAQSGFEAQVIPRELVVNAAAWSSTVGATASILGPAIGASCIAARGAAFGFAVVALFQSAGLLLLFSMKRRHLHTPEVAKTTEPLGQSIREGLRFVWQTKPLLGSMTLDLFAVLFGGAIALLPAFARDVLHVGPQGYGWLASAPAAGVACVMLYTTARPPIARAGRNLLLNVFGFGVCMIVFALSRNYWLSWLALFFSGMFDGVSMVIRGAILRLLTPDEIRGRVSSVSWIFIGSSNELGALESGLAAKWLGLTRSVLYGGFLTLAVVGGTWLGNPALRRLRLKP